MRTSVHIQTVYTVQRAVCLYIAFSLDSWTSHTCLFRTLRQLPLDCLQIQTNLPCQFWLLPVHFRVATGSLMLEVSSFVSTVPDLHFHAFVAKAFCILSSEVKRTCLQSSLGIYPCSAAAAKSCIRPLVSCYSKCMLSISHLFGVFCV